MSYVNGQGLVQLTISTNGQLKRPLNQISTDMNDQKEEKENSNKRQKLDDSIISLDSLMSIADIGNEPSHADQERFLQEFKDFCDIKKQKKQEELERQNQLNLKSEEERLQFEKLNKKCTLLLLLAKKDDATADDFYNVGHCLNQHQNKCDGSYYSRHDVLYWLQKAASQNHLESLFLIGKITNSILTIRKAARMNHFDSMVHLCLSYKDESYTWMQKILNHSELKEKYDFINEYEYYKCVLFLFDLANQIIQFHPDEQLRTKALRAKRQLQDKECFMIIFNLEQRIDLTSPCFIVKQVSAHLITDIAEIVASFCFSAK
jgi:hypothetical protein